MRVLKYFGKRMLSLLPKLLVISAIIFIGLQLLPGDAITRTVPPDLYAQMTPEQLDALRESLGLNAPLPIQYFRWLGKMLQGDLGYSIVSGSNISVMLAARLPATLELVGLGLLVATVLGLILGYFSAVKQNTPFDYLCTTFGMLGVSVPEFFLGMVVIVLFAIQLKWFPTGGRMAPGKEAFFDRIQYLVLPVFCLGTAYIATIMRYTRGSMLDVLNKDYITTARSKGLSENKVNFRHGFRNAIIPVIVTIVFRLPMLVGGTVVIESVFNYPGMGNMLLSAISGGDMPVVMISTFIIAIVVLLSSVLADLITAMLDPRIRLS